MLKFKTEYYRTIAKDTNAEKTVGELCDEIDRLRAPKQKIAPSDRERRLEAALLDIRDKHAMDNEGAGSFISQVNELEDIARAALAVPEETTVKAQVEKCEMCGRMGDPACKTVGCTD